MKAIDDAIALIRAAERIALATHVSPDPDAIGSMVGLRHGLSMLGKHVLMLCDDPVPTQLDFLPGWEQVCRSAAADFNPELLVGIDASDAERLGTASQALISRGLPVLNVDHHITNVNYGQVNLVLPNAASCAEVVLSILDALSVPLGDAVATCLMAGLVGDTRGFATSSVTPDTFRVAARLVDGGADIANIAEHVINRHSLDTLRLWGLALSDIHADVDVVWVAISVAERNHAGIRDISDTGLSSLLLSIPEAKISVVFVEQDDGSVSISMRAHPGFDVARVALSLGGGGHALASGCTIPGPLDQSIARVLPLLKSQTGPN